MDAAGARGLRFRIEQQEQWRQADAVLDGRQPPVDPDTQDLQGLGDGVRLYSTRATRGGVVRICKRLVDGVWEHGAIEETVEAPAREIVRVA